MIRRLLAVVAVVLAMSSTAAEAIKWRTPTYTLIARQMAVREAFDTFAVAQGLSVVMSDAVKGTFSGDFRQVPAKEFLDRVCTMHNLTWYYDGSAIYIYAAGEILTTLTDLAYMKATDVMALLKELGVEDARFPIKTASDGEIIMVSGPPRYVELVLQTIARADRLKQMRTFNEIDTRIFPLKNTWADSVSLQTSGPESNARIIGVAQLLQEIMLVNSAVKSKDISSNKTDTADAKVLDSMESAFHPVIRPENRLNAVIVRDSVTRMPMYERLIKELDKPQKLIEIQITTVEMTRDDALDWQLSVAVEGGKGKWDGGVGQNAQNLFDPTSLSGKGLAGAMTYLGDHVNVSASLSAMREKGKARNISRTALLTLNNMGAEMTDTQSYHARCVGTEVATLEEVTAGTKLGIKPRLVPSESTNTPNQVWLTMELQDGGFEAIAVDSMPMKRSSTLETQAAVNEGESIVLAGYFRDIQEEAGWGIPYLRDIPWIGWLFGGASYKDQTVQRLFILTPHVIDIGTADLARIQAAQQRDIRSEETLEQDNKIDREIRKERELKIKEADEIRTGEHEDRMERNREEMKFRKEQREYLRDKNRKDWREELDVHREQWRANPDQNGSIKVTTF